MDMDDMATTPNKEKTQDPSAFTEKPATPEQGKRITQFQALTEAADKEMDGALLTLQRILDMKKTK